MRIPRSRLRDQRDRGILARNHRSREWITRRPSSKLSRASHASVRHGVFRTNITSLLQFRGKTEEKEAQEKEVSCQDWWEWLWRGPNDGATFELCISHETLRETDPFVIHGTWEQCARVQQSFFSDKIRLW